MFSGIGGFELGINQAYGNYLRSRDGDSTKRNGEPNRLVESLQATDEDSQRQGDSPGTIQFRNIGSISCVGFSEIDKYAVQIYQSHFPTHQNYGDATLIDPAKLPDFDILVGGFPCQAFSIAGKRGGFEDTRGTLFFDIARILREKRPRNFVLENVKGLLSHDDGRTFKTIIAALVELGYGVEWQVLNSKNFGVPQNRERVFVVGYLGGFSGRQIFPLGDSNPNTIKELTTGAPQSRRAYATDGLAPTLDVQKGGNRQPKIINPKLQNYEPSEISVAITATSFKEPPVLLPQIRRLTPTECERLQSFPDNWTQGISDTQRYKCLGNAVTVNVVKYLIEQLYEPAIP